MSTKTETPSETIRRVTGATNLRADRLRDVLDSLTESKDAAEAVDSADLEGSANAILDALEALSEFVPSDLTGEVREAMESLVNALSDLPVDEFVAAYDAAEQALDVVEGYRDDPSSADAETKADARDECRAEFDTLADCLDAITPSEPVTLP